jgi:hypothetical protein
MFGLSALAKERPQGVHDVRLLSSDTGGGSMGKANKTTTIL